MSRRFALLLAAALLALCLACGGGDGDNTSNGQDGNGSNDETEEPSTTTAANGVEPNLEALSRAFIEGVDGKVTYRYISNFGQHPDGFWTDYHLQGTTMTRRDWRQEPNVFDAETYAIVNGEEGYVCTRASTHYDCSLVTPEEAENTLLIFNPVTEVPEAIVEGIEGLDTRALPGQTIAGFEALCFELDVPQRIDGQTPPAAEKIKLCFAPNGALLLMNRTVTFTDPALPPGQLDLEATEVTETSPSDFEPLASPVA